MLKLSRQKEKQSQKIIQKTLATSKTTSVIYSIKSISFLCTTVVSQFINLTFKEIQHFKTTSSNTYLLATQIPTTQTLQS